MDSMKQETIRCPQCGSLATKTITAITHENTVECRVCGYQKIEAVGGTDEFKGYGVLILNGTAVLFHEPIQFEKEQEILKSISENPNATFIKWTNEHGLTVLKGELPEDINEEYISHMMNEQDYYNSLRGDFSDTVNFT